jgi:hypothetical protein
VSDSHRPEPQSTGQAVGRVAGDVVTGLSTQPLLLAIIVLNVIGIAAAMWLLSRMLDHGAARHAQLMAYCLTGKVSSPQLTPQ